MEADHSTHKPKKKLLIRIAVLLSVLLLAAAVFFGARGILYLRYRHFRAADPAVNMQEQTQEASTMTNGDFYVSTTGSDSNDGSSGAPFRTVGKAMEAVRAADKTGRQGITVCIEPGEYRVSALHFEKEDSGTADAPVTYRANGGEAVLHAGVTLRTEDFRPVKDYPAVADRLSADAREHVVVLDLTQPPYSLTAADWGKLYALGSYHTADHYDGDWTGPLYCELFVNDTRQNLARYPDSGFLLTEEVVKTGQGKESDGARTAVKNWDSIRNPEPDVYRVNEALAARIGTWQNLQDVWMFGFWKYDWADASTPILSFDKTTRELTPRFVSLYGTKTDAPFYFFNVLEELTTAGEWYLDRENGLLCLWKPEDFDAAKIDLSLSGSPVINGEASHLVFDGLTLQGTRSDALVLSGDNITVQNCLVKNIAGNAICLTGDNNLVRNNEITRTGKGGIVLTGGDTQTLRAGGCRAENNLIHDWSEIYQTYQPAVTLNGVGNVCAHNEIYNSPHEAITYTGNNHIIEYNLIHDVCLLSDDAGAIYAGRSWIWYGNVIRYNCIYSLGSDGHAPDGIYMDDALSGQEITGNILVNIPRYAMHLGGGRDLTVTNNIVVNAGERAVSYDDRARDGALTDGWFDHAAKDGDMWTALHGSPWTGAVWREAFPAYTTMTDDFSKAETADFIPNPANSTLRGNVIFDLRKSIGYVSDAADEFSTIENNMILPLSGVNKFFIDAPAGDYRIADLQKLRESIPEFREIPLDRIGRTGS
ncbi:MAG: right-handed parallel beta-helix repeat-containing protein [Clostridia bacterium]|nr:right-handed parallel beta-helix repeat-containing protein [Clostridia bacterium]